MRKGLGRIERIIARDIAKAKNPGILGGSSVLIRTRDIMIEAFGPADWAHTGGAYEPLPAHRKATVRAMHSFVHKHPQYALMGGKGRKELILYEPADAVSVTWARLTVERRDFVSLTEAMAVLGRG